MKKILAILCLIILVSCTNEQKNNTRNENQSDFWEMKNDSKYVFYLSGGEDRLYVKKYNFMENGCCRVEYLTNVWEGGAKWDTAVVCGSFSIVSFAEGR